MHYHADELSRLIGSRLWSALVAPRPVFLIVSRSKDGIDNIAPYSSIGLISGYPPMISITFAKRHGQSKNTLQNILDTSDFSINAVPKSLAEVANESATGHEVRDDFARLSLTRLPFERTTISGIAEAAASIACRFSQSVQIEGPQNTLILARCTEVRFDEAYSALDIFDPLKANLIASVGAEDYISIQGEAFTLPRTWE